MVKGFRTWTHTTLHGTDHEESSAPHGKRNSPQSQQFWTPLHLKRRSLALFALIFAAIAIALGILALYSERNNGLSTADARDHYLWTYGPTAVFTVVAVSWFQVEYRSKQLQPWTLMRSGPQPAESSVLLDHVSSWNVFALFRSVRHGHILAGLGIAGSLLLKLVTVLSTGLFVLQNISMTQSGTPLHVTEAFGISNHSFWSSNFSTMVSDFRPVAVVLGLVGDHLTYPNGTTANQTFLQFTPVDTSGTRPNATEATIDVFESTLDCEAATFTLNKTLLYPSNETTEYPTWTATHVSSQSCANAAEAGFGIGDFWEFSLSEPPVFDAARVKCGTYPQNDGTNGIRMLFYNGNLYKQAGKLQLNITALLCASHYQVSQASVEIDQIGKAGVRPASSSIPSKQIEGLEQWTMGDAFMYSVGEAGESLINAAAPNITGQDAFETDLGVFWQFLNTINPQKSVQDWQNLTLANTTLQNAWSMWTAQMASLHLKVPANETVLGNSTMVRPRLTIHTASLWSMEGVLLALVIVAIALGFVVRKDVMPRDPASLGGMATLLNSSPELQTGLQGSWRYSDIPLSQHLQGQRFSTSMNVRKFNAGAPTFAINQTASQEKATNDPTAQPEDDWWRPSAVTYRYIAAVSFLLVILIALLEGLYQYSLANNGLGSVEDPDSAYHFLWTTIPALILVLAAGIVGMLHFAIQVLQPYQGLKRGSASARTGLFRYPFSGSWFVAFTDAFTQREFAIVLTTVSVILSSFLTIVVSGLYTAIPTLSTEAMNVQEVDHFGHATSLSNQSPIQIELVTLGNLSYPRFTYETLAFPTLKAPADANGTVNLQVSALQGSMNCSAFPSEDIVAANNTFTWGEMKGNDIFYGAVKDPSGCLENLLVSNELAPEGTSSFTMYIDTTYRDGEPFLQMPTTGYFGYAWGLGTENSSCPTLLGVVGQTDAHKIVDYTLFRCFPNVRQVTANASFLLPAMDINKAAPPVVSAGSPTPFEISFATFAGWGVVEGTPMQAFEQFHLPATAPDEMFGPFMNVLIGGTQGIPAAQLVGEANTGRLFSAMDYLWGVGIAQLMSDYRVASDPNTAPITGTRTYPGPYRVVQSAVSTRILEGLLAAILICSVAAFFAMGSSRILKHNPCSIAGMASLLIDSELLTKGTIPEGAEWQSDKQLLKAGVFDGWVFSLGWWSASDGEQEQRFGVDVGKADRVP